MKIKRKEVREKKGLRVLVVTAIVLISKGLITME